MLPSSYLPGGTSLVTEQTGGCPTAWCTAPWQDRLCSQQQLRLCPHTGAHKRMCPHHSSH